MTGESVAFEWTTKIVEKWDKIPLPAHLGHELGVGTVNMGNTQQEMSYPPNAIFFTFISYWAEKYYLYVVW